MRPPSILDVVRAVKAVAAAHQEVSAWWYAPPKRLRLAGERPGEASKRQVEIAIEGRFGAETCDAIAREISRALRDTPRDEMGDETTVRVRPYRGPRDDGHLFRLLSADKPAGVVG